MKGRMPSWGKDEYGLFSFVWFNNLSTKHLFFLLALWEDCRVSEVYISTTVKMHTTIKLPKPYRVPATPTVQSATNESVRSMSITGNKITSLFR